MVDRHTREHFPKYLEEIEYLAAGKPRQERTFSLHYLDIAAKDEPGAVGAHGVVGAFNQNVPIAEQRWVKAYRQLGWTLPRQHHKQPRLGEVLVHRGNKICLVGMLGHEAVATHGVDCHMHLAQHERKVAVVQGIEVGG